MSKNLKAQKSAILLNQGKVRAMQWRRYLENNWDKLTKNLNNATILFLTGRHGLEDGKIGAADETILTNQAEQNEIFQRNNPELKRDMNRRNIVLEILDVHPFYNEKKELNIKGLKVRILEIDPSLIIISICFSETLDLRFALEVEGIFPNLRLQQELTMLTEGKQIDLDSTQRNLLYTVAKDENIEKMVIIHGPEGSGKTILAMEVVKMKLSHYLRKYGLKAKDGPKVIQLIVCGFYAGDERVPILMRQLREESNDIKDFCTISYMPIPMENIETTCPKSFQEKLEEFSREQEKQYPLKIFMTDELFPDFPTSQWKYFKGASGAKTDFVLALRHAFHDYPLLSRLQKWTKRLSSYEEIMKEQGVAVDVEKIVCRLRMSYRCTKEVIALVYYLLMHAPSENRLYETKSFIHSEGAFSGEKPLWLEVPDVEVFIKFSNSYDGFKNVTDAMVLYTPNYDSYIIHALRRHCLEKSWRLCASNSVMGAEASTVIIFDMMDIKFEALSRAVHTLIFVTTPSTKGGALNQVLRDITEKIHHKDTCKRNRKENGSRFGHNPHSCSFSTSLELYVKNAECKFEKILAHKKVDFTDLPDDVEDLKENANVRASTIIDTSLQLILLADLKSDVAIGCRRFEDLIEIENLLKEKSSQFKENLIGATEDLKKLFQFSPGLGKVMHEFTNKELFKIASEKEDWELFVFLAKELDEDDQKDENGWSPLHYYATAPQRVIRRRRIFQRDISKGAVTEFLSIFTDKNPRDKKDVTPLHILAKNGCNLDLFNLVMDVVDDKSPVDEYGFTPLHYAAENGHLEQVQSIAALVNSILLESTKPVQYKEWPIALSKMTPLHLAAMNGHFPILKHLVTFLKDDINPPQGEGLTALHLAAFYGHFEIVSFYTKQLDEVNPIGNGYWNCRTPLHLAACGGQLDVVKHFCDKLQDKNPCDETGMTPLHEAAKKGHLEVVRHLLLYVDDKEPKCKDYPLKDATPLDLAKDYRHSEVISLLEGPWWDEQKTVQRQ